MCIVLKYAKIRPKNVLVIYLISWYYTAPECNVYEYFRVRFPRLNFQIV